MAIESKNYVIYDLVNRRWVRTSTASDDVAFNSLSVGGLSGPVVTSTSDGQFSFGSKRITLVSDPAASTDVATKNYVDTAISSFSGDVKESVRVATNAALPANTYNNGTGGVGATITANGSASLNSVGIDGVTDLQVGDRVLVKNEGLIAVPHTSVNTTSDVITVASHGLSDNEKVVMIALPRFGSAQGSLPGLASGSIIPGKMYYVINSNASEFQLATSMSGTALDFATVVSGQYFAVAKAYQGGIYTITDLGSPTTQWVLTRATDANTSTLLNSGCLVSVEEGTVNKWLVYENMAAGTGTMGSHPIVFGSFQNQMSRDVDMKDAVIGTTVMNGSLTLVPNGTGALKLSAGGNTRGTNSVDLQIATSGSYVTSGSGAFSAGLYNTTGGANAVTLGVYNRASGSGAVAIGSNNSAAGDRGIALGFFSAAQGTDSGALSGYLNVTTGNYSVITGGNTNANSGSYAAIGGGTNNTLAGSWTGIFTGQSNSVGAANNSTILGGWGNSIAANSNTASILGGFSNSISTGASAGAAILGGRYNVVTHNRSCAMGGAAATAADHDLVIGNSSAVTAGNISNVHFRVAGNNSNVVVGRATNQDPVAGATNTLELHTTGSNQQLFYIGLKAPSALTASTTYTLPAEGTYGQFLQTDGSGNLAWDTVDLSSVTLDQAYINGNTITTVSSEGNVVIAGTETLEVSASGGLLMNGGNIDMKAGKIYTTTTNGKIVVAPDGTGAFQLSTSGSARGTNAVDLQIGRLDDSQVAKGNFSFVTGFANKAVAQTCAAIGGSSNTSGANGQEGCLVAGGASNSATVNYASVVGGQGNLASEESAIVAGGASNTASKQMSAVLGGTNNTASAIGSVVIGGSYNAASSIGAAVIGGIYNTANQAHSVAIGKGAQTTASFDLVIGNNDSASSSSTDNVHFRVAGDTSNVKVGRTSNQDPVDGATNTLELHTTGSNLQANYIGLKAPASLAASTTYTLPADGTDGYALKTNGSGALYWDYAITYTKSLTNVEGSTMTNGAVAYIDTAGSVKLVNAADVFVDSSLVFVMAKEEVGNGNAGLFYYNPDVEITASRTSGVLTGGFILAPMALGNNPATTIASSSSVTIAVPVGHGILTTDVVTLAGLTGFDGLLAGDLNGDQTVVATTASSFTFVSTGTATAGATGGGASGTWTRHKLLVKEPVYLSKVDGKVLQDISAFVAGDAIVRIGYPMSPDVLKFDPEYVLTLA